MSESAASGGLGRRLARNTLQTSSGRVLAIVVWLVLTPWLYRALGVEQYAVWSLFYALTGWLGALDLGFSQVALRYVAAARARDDHAEAGEYATLAAMGYVALGVVWLALAPLVREPVLDFLRIAGPARA